MILRKDKSCIGLDHERPGIDLVADDHRYRHMHGFGHGERKILLARGQDKNLCEAKAPCLASPARAPVNSTWSLRFDASTNSLDVLAHSCARRPRRPQEGRCAWRRAISGNAVNIRSSPFFLCMRPRNKRQRRPSTRGNSWRNFSAEAARDSSEGLSAARGITARRRQPGKRRAGGLLLFGRGKDEAARCFQIAQFNRRQIETLLPALLPERIRIEHAMRHEDVVAAVALARLSRHGIQRVPERVQMNDVGQPNRFIDCLDRTGGVLQDAGTTYRENLSRRCVDAVEALAESSPSSSQ